MKKYTVSEIDALRRACDLRYLYGTTNLPGNGGISRSYSEVDKNKAVEELVRTYMLAGLTAEDIYASDEPIKIDQASHE